MSNADTAQFLICLSGELRYALPVGQVIETMRPLPTESLAGMPPFVLGVATIRGEVVPVVNLAGVVGPSTAIDPGRYVTLRLDGRTVAVAVEDVIGLRQLPATSLAALPPLLRDTHGDLVSAITVLDTELVLVLRNSHLIPETLWVNLDSQDAPL